MNKNVDMENDGCAGFLLMIFIIFLSTFITGRVYESKPQALDVYQGKTTLEYKVVDGVIVDSCVIWKEDYKEL